MAAEFNLCLALISTLLSKLDRGSDADPEGGSGLLILESVSELDLGSVIRIFFFLAQTLRHARQAGLIGSSRRRISETNWGAM